jgi:TraM recognition site of TraD and TraG/Type IV secretory system Conjugative DNA transfer
MADDLFNGNTSQTPNNNGANNNSTNTGGSGNNKTTTNTGQPNDLSNNGNFISNLRNSNFDFSSFANLVIYISVAVVLGYLSIQISLRLFRFFNYQKNKILNWNKTVFLEIAVPKETAEQVQKEYGNNGQKETKESLSVCEQLFLVMAEYAQKDWKDWLFGSERFSLEIVNIDQEVRFWLVCSQKTAEVMERQIISIYPKAHITRLKKTNFFKKDTTSYVQELDLSTRFELPFKTYKLLDNDPLNAVTNALSGIEKNESCAVQLIITPIQSRKWQKQSQLMALKIQQGQNPKEILYPEFNFFKEVGKFLKAIIKEIRGSKPDEKKTKEERDIDLTGRKSQLSLTPQQQEIIKKLEEKAAKPGFKFTLRIVGTSSTEEKAKRIVENIIPAFQIYDIRPFNGFKKKKKINQRIARLNFTLRSPILNQKNILNTEEINSLWHVPGWQVQTSAIKWLLARRPPIPLNTPPPDPKNVYIGKAAARGVTKDIYLTTEDRFRHIYSLGGSGSGKSVTMTEVALQDIKMGNGVCVVDPHGELIDQILRRIPEDRIDDVIVFSPSITDRPLGLNMLETDPLKPEQKTLVIDTLFAIWDKLYDLKKTGGPMFENYMKNAMRLVMSHPESGSTLMEIPKVLTDEDFRAFKLAMCNEQEVVDFWEKEATKAGGEASLENMIPYITSKLAPFITNDFIKPMVGQQKSVINFREAMDNRKIILVSLAKGMIGEQSAYLIGMVIVGGLLMAGMGRSDGLKYNEDGTTTQTIKKDLPPFFVYIDEMQNFLFDAIPKALEEIRKYRVGFYLAHQFVKQVVVDGSERIKDSLMANCATKIIYRCGADDAKYLETEFSPLTTSDIANPEAYTFNTICLVNGQRTTPFNVQAYYPEFMESEKTENVRINEAKRLKIIDNIKKKYGRDRDEVEKEIKDRAKIFF